jgi:hypothetical protein
LLAWRVLDARLRRNCPAEFVVLRENPLLVSGADSYDCVEVRQQGLSCDPHGKTVVDAAASVFFVRSRGAWIVAYSVDGASGASSTIDPCTPDERQRFEAGTART